MILALFFLTNAASRLNTPPFASSHNDSLTGRQRRALTGSTFSAPREDARNVSESKVYRRQRCRHASSTRQTAGVLTLCMPQKTKAPKRWMFQGLKLEIWREDGDLEPVLTAARYYPSLPNASKIGGSVSSQLPTDALCHPLISPLFRHVLSSTLHPPSAFVYTYPIVMKA